MNDNYGERFFLDTNILIYSFDHSDKIKRNKAQELVSVALSSGLGVISYQVVQEFLNVAGKKFVFPSAKLRLYFDKVLDPLCEVYPDMKLYRFAVDIKDRFKFSFYDSLIIASAIESDCKVLYSEDLQDGQVLLGLKVKNPFSS
ncbi:MAG: PIN domain-containing protein [Gammaproteobacteria bacterium]|nr:PIN domain-containing protein [Gammaproteobacteria bacterium]